MVVGLGLSAMGLFWLWMYLRFMKRLHGYRRGIIDHLGKKPEKPAAVEEEKTEVEETTTTTTTTTTTSTTTTAAAERTTTEAEATDSAAGYLVETEDGRLVYWPAATVPRIIQGPAYVADRTPTPPDCSRLRRRWQELRRDAVLWEYRVAELRQMAERAQTACDQARQRVAGAQALLADLEPRTDAPEYHTRMTWLQQELSAAQGEASAACAQAERAAADAAEAEAGAEEARAEADVAQAAYEACVKGVGR